MGRHESGLEPIIVTHAVFEGLDLIRRQNACNMFDIQCVIAVAKELGQDATAAWIRARQGDYAAGIIRGFTASGADFWPEFWSAEIADFDEEDSD